MSGAAKRWWWLWGLPLGIGIGAAFLEALAVVRAWLSATF